MLAGRCRWCSHFAGAALALLTLWLVAIAVDSGAAAVVRRNLFRSVGGRGC